MNEFDALFGGVQQRAMDYAVKLTGDWGRALRLVEGTRRRCRLVFPKWKRRSTFKQWFGRILCDESRRTKTDWAI